MLACRTTEISIQFKQQPHLLFEGLRGSSSPANTLIMRIQPDEGVMLNFNLKIPGFTTETRTVNMDFSYGSSFTDELPEAYERLLLDALLGDSTLFTRSDEVETAWSFITSIRSGWEHKGPLENGFLLEFFMRGGDRMELRCSGDNCVFIASPDSGKRTMALQLPSQGEILLREVDSLEADLLYHKALATSAGI